jgi:death-on-curing family protein
MEPVTYPTADEVVKQNALILRLVAVKRADRAQVLNRSALRSVIADCESRNDDIYSKAAVLLIGIIRRHPFASGNRRTAFLVTKQFLLENGASFGVQDEPSQAKVLQGIREHFYSEEDILRWLRTGDIHAFKRS